MQGHGYKARALFRAHLLRTANAPLEIRVPGRGTRVHSSAYWAGYRRGMWRGFFGARFNSPQAHKQLMDLKYYPEGQTQAWMGYHDGMAWAQDTLERSLND